MSDLVIKCPVCQSVVDEEDLFCPNCGTEAPRPEKALPPVADTSRLATCNFECAHCGASMSYDAKAGSLRCPFCASAELTPKPDATILSPRAVVPFIVSREQATQTMRTWLGRGFFRPGDLAIRAAVVRMQPVYVPYWVFQATTHTYWTADSSQTPAGARADWYPLSGQHEGRYENLLIGASGALSPAETSQLCPFDLAVGVSPEKVDLENITVEQFSVPRKYARPLARGAIESLEAQTCAAQYVPGRARNVHVNVMIESMTGEPVLLPVWIMAYRYGDRVFRFLVNGQTGKPTGQAPVSWWKVTLTAMIILAIILLVLFFLALFGLAGSLSHGHLHSAAQLLPPVSAVVRWYTGRLPSSCRSMSEAHVPRTDPPQTV